MRANKRYLGIIIGVIFSLSLNAQEYIQPNNEHFYYYKGEKMFLQQNTKRLLIRFAADMNKEQVLSLIGTDTVLQRTTDLGLEHLDISPLKVLILESKDGKEIPQTTIDFYKAKEQVVSAAYMLLGFQAEQGLCDEFVVYLKPTTSYDQLVALAAENSCIVGKENPFVKNQFMLHVQKTSLLDAMQLSNLFYETGLFEIACPNFIGFNLAESNDTYWGDQWGLKNIGQYGGTLGIDIRAEYAHQISTGKGVVCAIIDSGVDLEHPDLKRNLLQGYDAEIDSIGGGPVYSIGDEHGTACASICGSVKGNGIGVAGVAPDCRMIPIYTCIGHSAPLVNDYIANSINYAWKNGASVINCSWFCTPNPLVTKAIDSALLFGRSGLGCVFVKSAGNGNNPFVTHPGERSDIITVGAISPCGERKSVSWIYDDIADQHYPITSCDHEEWGSNYGENLDVMAPGVLISTADRRGSEGINPNIPKHLNMTQNGTPKVTADYADQDYTVWFHMTSAACPHVSGIAALILSVNPNLTWWEVKNIIESTCSKVRPDLYTYQEESGRSNGLRHNEMGYGLVNAHKAVLKAYFWKDTFAVSDANVIVCNSIVANYKGKFLDATSLFWKTSNNLSIVSGQETPTIKCKGIIAGAGWIECYIVRYGDTLLLEKKNINVINRNVSQTFTNYSSSTGSTLIQNGDRAIAGTFTVNAGSTVSIKNCAVYCSPGAQIIVKSGGKLVLDGTKLVNDCEDATWQGIMVIGNDKLPQTDANQGVVELKNGSVIDGAVCGIYIGNKGYLNGGGIVRADSAHFINNQQAVCFIPYSDGYYANGWVRENKSYFNKCEFRLDKADILPASAHVELNEVEQIPFTNCTFADNRTKKNMDDYTIGIYSNSSSIMVGEYIKPLNYSPAPHSGCSFSGFKEAVYLSNNGNAASKIYASTFTDNYIGILAESSPNLTVGKCHFNIPSQTYSPNNTGIYLQSSALYNVVNNYFEGADSTKREGIGIVCEKTGTTNNFVKNNTFKYLCTACHAVGINGEYSSKISQGLVYQCNKFEKNYKDISTAPGSTIRLHQTGYYDVHASGNVFDSSTYNIYNEGNYFIYYYLWNYPKHDPRFKTYDNFNVSLLPVDAHCCVSYGYSGDYYYMEAPCVNNPPLVQNDMNQLNTKYQTTEVVLEIKKTKSLSYTMSIDWKDIMVQSIVSQLDMLDEFTFTINGLSPSNDLEEQIVLFYEISNAKQQMDKICYAALDLLANNEEGLDLNAYRLWISRFNTVESDYALADSYISTGNFVEAKIIWEKMPTKFPELNEETHQHYWDYFNIARECSALKENDTIPPYMMTGLVNLLSYDDFVAVRAYALGEKLFENWAETYPRTFEAHPSCVCSQGKENQQSQNAPINNSTPPQDEQTTEKPIVSIEKKGEIVVKPNPTKGQLQITNYELRGIENVEIYSVMGQKLNNSQLSILNSQLIIDVSHLANGMYYLKITLEDGSQQVRRFVKE